MSVTDEASDFKFGVQLWLEKAHNKITPRGKSGRGPGLGELPKIWGFFHFSATAQRPTSNFACSWGLPRAIVKSHADEKSGRGPGLGSSP